MNENIFKADAKSIVDTLFDTKVFTSRVTRDDMAILEELISFTLQSRFEGYVRANKLIESIQSRKPYSKITNEESTNTSI